MNVELNANELQVMLHALGLVRTTFQHHEGRLKDKLNPPFYAEWLAERIREIEQLEERIGAAHQRSVEQGGA